MKADKGGSLAPTFLLKDPEGKRNDSGKTFFFCPFIKGRLLYFSQTIVSAFSHLGTQPSRSTLKPPASEPRHMQVPLRPSPLIIWMPLIHPLDACRGRAPESQGLLCCEIPFPWPSPHLVCHLCQAVRRGLPTASPPWTFSFGRAWYAANTHKYLLNEVDFLTCLLQKGRSEDLQGCWEFLQVSAV